MSDNTNMQNAIAAKRDVEQGAITKKPLEWLAITDEAFVQGMHNLSAAVIQDTDQHETSKILEWTKKAQKSLKNFEENARERMGTFFTQFGKVVTEKGSLEIKLDGGFRQRAIPTNTKPDDSLTFKMLKAKGLSPDIHMSKIVTWEVDEMKLKQLLDEEKITDAEYKQCFKETKAYRIMPPEPDKEDE